MNEHLFNHINANFSPDDRDEPTPEELAEEQERAERVRHDEWNEALWQRDSAGEPKHTPGPWEFYREPWETGALTLSGYRMVVTVQKNQPFVPQTVCNVFPPADDCPSCVNKRAERDATAQLISAAPDLLEACELAYCVFEDTDQKDDEPALTLIAAIRKAKGGTP